MFKIIFEALLNRRNAQGRPLAHYRELTKTNVLLLETGFSQIHRTVEDDPKGVLKCWCLVFTLY